MTYISAQQAAIKWGISKRRVQTLCSTQRIPDTVRIGNMWVVPENAQKPDDARKKIDTSTAKLSANPIKAARRALRAISAVAYMIAKKEISRTSDAKKTIMALFSQELLNHVLAATSKPVAVKNDITESHIYEMFGASKHLSSASSSRIGELFKSYLAEHPFCIDDALSWAYQFVNKQALDTGLESTQFFTEKYMISTLVDQCRIETGNGKILDPACGGGNFLLYALDYLCDSTRLFLPTTLPDYVHAQLRRLYGYELDPTLAIIASVNLRIKALSILKEHGDDIAPEDFFACVPNIYGSAEDNMEGALDANPSAHRVVRVGMDQAETLASVFNSAEFVFTNPPFQTVKGMAEDQKAFLKKNFPNAKCDMCNAFLEFVLDTLAENGTCGLVTQNSWMYLDSFEQLRLSLLQQYTIKSIIELGSNAFYDISGEKANVALLLAQKTTPNAETTIAAYSLKHLSQTEIEPLLSSEKVVDNYMVSLNQLEVIQSPGARFGTLSTSRTQSLQNSCPAYGEYAVPMQGTSTGDSKSLVRYFWEHIGDSDWCPVSKGGGFSRWVGLNSYSVKWGHDGEYIEKTPGSAIRNAKHFGETQLVFSDTGTAGLNVRLLREGQIFIASGPGIRVTQGDPLAHIAFLNSRFASYYIRLLSPKLTIAAGYIAKIPVFEKLLSSEKLAENAKICIELKKKRLSKRPVYLEFVPLVDVGHPTTLDEQATQWFLGDMDSEWKQLCAEKEIDREVLNAFDLSACDRESIDVQVGCHALDIQSSRPLSIIQLDRVISELLSANCMCSRTRPDKNHLGCDGVLEYLVHKNTISASRVRRTISENVQGFHRTLAKYRDAYIHCLLLSALGYSANSLPDSLPQETAGLVKKVGTRYPSLLSELAEIENWIKTRFNAFHRAAFFDTPIIQYSAERDVVESIRGLE